MAEVETEESIPDAESLIESMRAVGYSPETAISDLIDNSIAAGASEVEIQYDATTGRPFVAVLDNGSGMNLDELRQAMRHGSQSPNVARKNTDLGRFGLGLKTASLSQCRRLTVASKKDGAIHARQWDLDVVKKKQNWVTVIPTSAELEKLPKIHELSSRSSGTLVVWEELDRLVAGASDMSREMTLKMQPLYAHLALVFHRYLNGGDGPFNVAMWVNGLTVAALDPFLRSNTHRQVLEGQVIRHPRGDVAVQPYVLPPVSRLTPEEIHLAGGADGLRGTQGFYVYRNFRLVVWGTWFKLVPKTEFFKLTRVLVDIPNTFDDLWALDIKKSAAYPPEPIRRRLQELIPHFAAASRLTITYPGRKATTATRHPLWVRVEPKIGSFRYEIDVEHPAVAGFAARIGPSHQHQLQALLALTSELVPYEGIYSDMCGDSRVSAAADYERIRELASALMEVGGLPFDKVLSIDPIDRFPQFHQQLEQELT